jgi:hypothetical protein
MELGNVNLVVPFPSSLYDLISGFTHGNPNGQLLQLLPFLLSLMASYYISMLPSSASSQTE